jgi:hypothetical protein
VLRAGFGMYYQTLGNGGCGCTLGFAGPPGVLPSDGRNPAFYWDTGLSIPQGAKPPFIDPSFGNFLDVDYTGPDFGKAPRIYDWNVSLQHTIKNFLIDVAYVGNRGSRLNSTLEANQVDPKHLSLGPLMRLPITDPQVVARGFTKPFSSFPDRESLAQALRPYPQYRFIADRNSGDGRSWYDAFQAKVERRFGMWQLMGAYTFSKSQGQLHYRQIFSQNFNAGGQAQNNFDISDTKSYLPFDLPHMFNWLNSIDLPFGRGRKWMSGVNRATDLFVGGWNVGFIQRIFVPAPVYIGSTNTLANVLFTRYRKANQTGTPIRSSGERDLLDPGNPGIRWFTPCQAAGNTCVNGTAPFASPTEFAFGYASSFHTDLRNPLVMTESLSINKSFALVTVGERVLNFRYSANIFNLFNRTKFGVNGNYESIDFGRATGPQVGARLITMGLLLEF